MIKFIKKLRYIVANFDSLMDEAQRTASLASTYARQADTRSRAAQAMIKERTEVSASLSCTAHGRNSIIVIGRYKKADYVQTYSVDSRDFESLIQQLRSMDRYGTVNKLEAVPELRAIISKETQY